MPTERSRRKKKSPKYDILFVPDGEGGKTRRYRAGVARLIFLGVFSVFAVVGLTLVALLYTPLALYLPITSPELEAKYGQLAAETQRQLQLLTDDVVLLKDYNQQLRKALGEKPAIDTARSVPRPLYLADASTGSLVKREGDHSVDFPTFIEEGDLPVVSYAEDYSEAAALRVSFPLMAPAEGFVTQGFEPSRKHYGIDFATKRGSPVYAGTDGYIVFAGWTYEDGHMIILSHGGGYLSVYKHNQALVRGVHEFVKRGELIAVSGASGKTSRGPHVHFEVWKDGVPQNPNDYLLSPTVIQ